MATASTGFSLAIEYHREEDGRWLADIAALPGVTAYGRSRRQATVAVQALALRLIADRLEHGEAVPGPMNVSFICRLKAIPGLAIFAHCDDFVLLEASFFAGSEDL
jgi:predicted RNase H-like HicB family nuclease